MAVKKNQKTLLTKLKKQVRLLQRKEEQSRNKLKAALAKARKLGRNYKTKLKGKMRAMKGKIAEAQSSAYGKLAANLEREILKGIERKAKSLASVLSKIEKKQAAKLTKGLTKKGKKPRKANSAKRTTKTSKRKRK